MAMQVILIMKQEEGEVLDRSSSSLVDASWTNESCALRKQNALCCALRPDRCMHTHRGGLDYLVGFQKARCKCGAFGQFGVDIDRLFLLLPTKNIKTTPSPTQVNVALLTTVYNLMP
jgi:hypothetical protein